MIQYVKFGISCTAIDSKLAKIYEDFKVRCAKYCVDEEMELYYIPIKSSVYEYAHQLALCYPASENIWDDTPAMCVTESSLLQTEYDKMDFENAIAYVINFSGFAYDYENLSSDEFVDYCCDEPSWSIESCMIQNKNYMIPKSAFGKKKYAKLMLGYAVADEVREQLIHEDLASDKDFRDVITKKGEHVCNQIVPEHIVSGFMVENNAELVDVCRHCGKKRYNPCKEPYYMSEQLASGLHGLNQTGELYGPIIEEVQRNRGESFGSTLEPLYIMNKKTYAFLHERYPRMQFIPIFRLG